MDLVVREGDVLIIVPPFAALRRPSLAAHVLQASAAAAGIRVSVLYANMLLAARIGVAAYDAISDAPPHPMIGERFFARAAHGLSPFGLPAGARLKPEIPEGFGLDEEELLGLEALAPAWAEDVAEAVARLGFPVVGSTTTFEQTNASLALLRCLKRARPETVTLLGGANCEGAMAEGIASLDTTVDHIFSGESEVSFPAFLRDLFAGRRPSPRIVEGSPCRDLDAIPTPDFGEYFEQRARFLPDGGRGAAPPLLPYESSRGCWWGQKHHCTFCGLNGQGMVFREKSPERVVRDLEALSRAHGTRLFTMTDNIMPHSYFKTLLPMLSAAGAPVEIFYEQKANLSLDDVIALKAAGVSSIQPGIEALSSALLRRMDKGVLGRQNVMLLRHARAVGLDVQWNLLWGFPGDEIEAYEETLAVVPLLGHLQPPTGMQALSIDRFSPYFDRAREHGISDLQPHPAYRVAFPPGTDYEKVAYRFNGRYDSGALRRRDVITALDRAVEAWRAGWSRGAPPTLRLNRVGDYYVVRDTRGLPGSCDGAVLDHAQAASALRAGPRTAAHDAWIDAKLGVVLDGWYVPLGTAATPILVALEQEERLARRAEARRSLPMISSAC